ncbi:hypothetical protein BB559_001540 [Furculomyces boomerangus]|uniref:RNA methyltransferase n=1 Tax=Furculomyces boomerangus TaxID=61424 RepID=A0A2T9Z1J3_9FUNG|nr:hypothetical protein BB559_001540 [Furculomyces boomerangus]
MKRKASTNKPETHLRYGNYPNYYGYRNPGDWTDDPRIKAIPSDIFNDSVCLDIGCNTGIVTIELAKNPLIKNITGVDIDKKLIRTSRQNLYFANSLQFPDIDQDLIDNVVDHSDHRNPNYNYFPISMPVMYGTIPCKPHSFQSKEMKEQNMDLEKIDFNQETKSNSKISTKTSKMLSSKVFFYSVDWVNENTEWIDEGGYDVVFA